ncbi:MAG: ATP-binding cassette domain-containing protein [Raoultibacter sp.]|jgi:macrolide transport system ATP-binding/permease protein
MQLNLSHITYTYPGTIDPVFVDTSLTFPQGWTGIVGNNGSGKSTLAHIASNDLVPDEGFVSPRLVSAYCLQETETPPEAGMDFVSDYGKEALLLKGVLGIEDDWIWRFDTLSHGERKRLQIGTALWLESDVLVVDEPTNHLDAATKDVLLRALQSFKGIGIIISHDRTLLDALVDQCIFVRGQTALMRPGSYSQGAQQAEVERLTNEREHRDARRNLSRLKQEKVQRAEMADKAKGRRSARNIDPKDHDAKAKIGLAVFTGQDGKRGKLSTQMDSHLDRAAKRVEESKTEKNYDGCIWMEAHPAHRKVVLRYESGSLPLNESRRLSFPDLMVGNTDHIGITGVNGSGKSTLLRHLIEHIDEDLRVVYIPQELNAEQSREILKLSEELSSERKGLLYSIVAQLNSNPKAMMQGDMVSPGELRKLILAFGLTTDPDIIIMDEPTNHLDILSTESMERVLRDCPCTLLLVSHDESFVKETTTIGWHLTQDKEENSLLEIVL